MTDGPSLLSAALDAPLLAVLKRWPNTTHAITMESVIDGWDRGTFTSACGMKTLRLVGNGNGAAVCWPPRIKGCPMERCRECWVATGKKRPRSHWTRKDNT